MNSSDLYRQVVDKIKTRTLEHWLMLDCIDGDTLKIIRSEDSGVKVTSLYNERTNQIYVAVTTHSEHD